MRVLASGAIVALLVSAGCQQALGFEDPEVVELGAICTGGGDGACPAAAPRCVSLNGTTFQCTASCGSSTAGSGSAVPPPNGDATCRSLISAGTPVCNVAGEATNGVVPWFCGVLCGTSGATDFGTCPPGLACTSNICQ